MDTTSASGSRTMSFHIQDAAKGHLDDSEQRRLVREAQEGSMEARERLIVTNMKLAIAIAQGYTERGMPFDDILQECLLGMNSAIDGYDLASKAKFTTYATRLMRSWTTRATDNGCSLIRISVGHHERNRAIDRRRMALAQELGRMPDSGEIADSFLKEGNESITESSIEEIRRLFAGNRKISIDAPFPGAHLNRGSAAEDIIGSDAPSPDEIAVIDERRQALEEAVSALPWKEEVAIRARYGMPREGLDLPVIRNGEEATYDEIAEAVGVTNEGARFLVRNARKRMATKNVPAFIRLREIVDKTGI